jgi:hypothetical protein
VPDTRLGCPGLRCGERLNRKALRARLQQLGRGHAALATVNHAAHKTGIQPATLGDKTFYVSHLGGLHSRPSPIAAASFLAGNLPIRLVRSRGGHGQVIIIGRVTNGPRPCPLVAQSGHLSRGQQCPLLGVKVWHRSCEEADGSRRSRPLVQSWLLPWLPRSTTEGVPSDGHGAGVEYANSDCPAWRCCRAVPCRRSIADVCSESVMKGKADVTRNFFNPLVDFIAPDTLVATPARGEAPMRAGRSHRRSDPDGSRPRHGVSRGAQRGSGWCNPKRR